MGGALYARWVPPQRAAPRAQAVKPDPSHETHPSTGDGEQAFKNDSPNQRTDSAQKKRKRASKTAEQPVEGDVSVPKKHQAVLSKFERSSKRAETVRAAAQQEESEDETSERTAEVLQDLVPIPQPAPVSEAPFEPTFSALPSWLANPVTVSSSKTVPLSTLSLHPAFLKKLNKQGFEEALAVQSALWPMLRPGFEEHLGDICVSARTGSGKTLAYLLPIIEALREQTVTTLSALIVVPTRQLVDQALKVAEELCAGTKLKVGTALGNVPFAVEQKHLVKVRPVYNPEKAKELRDRASQQLSSAIAGSNGFLGDFLAVPNDHIPEYESGVDILICTPGRLVEHIESTTGFLLRYVRWLVIDEADQLLTQNFQGWATVLMNALHNETPEDFMNAQESFRKRIQASVYSMALPSERHVTKVVLSATMKKDLTKLGILRLKRPKLVVIEDETDGEQMVADGDSFELPSTLSEYGVPVGDGSNKPLYLLFTLLRHIFAGEHADASTAGALAGSTADESGAKTTSRPTGVANLESSQNRVLVFVKSNENASRLSHLLSVLEPPLQPFIGTMTPSASAKETQKLLRSFGSGKTKLLIASDAASRGLDIPGISHVINYDIPTSTVSYVHRVGRTARAGKDGHALTFVTKSEAGWFWNQIAKGTSMKRGGNKVTRVEMKERDVTWDRKRTYQEALKELQGAVEA
ncbi:P-loop containing nucleoside triphosphate hydrolase protein [Sporormia fimetaria CBS 119925]|uniref:ATP-dependent RNA helicase n=1 Tax=Sporormia fimetaria CBS 119925 TaxID=1340428 RepID=A0A6A6VJR1_9PLEO|nr:P-loop containing nucleoside triphosphate hydrolase protein [Sporormia fimetaria CBS 119925]